MKQSIPTLLVIEAVTFFIAALIHSGVVITGYEHDRARIAEGVIALVLLVTAVLISIRPQWTRKAGLAAQAFALFGTSVGVSTIIVGIGPRTYPDIVYHVVIIVLLAWSLSLTKNVSA